jgi:hypothetical protein
MIDWQVRKLHTTPRSHSEYEQGPVQNTKHIWLRAAEPSFKKASHIILTRNGTRKPSPEPDNSSLYIQTLCIEYPS